MRRGPRVRQRVELRQLRRLRVQRLGEIEERVAGPRGQQRAGRDDGEDRSVGAESRDVLFDDRVARDAIGDVRDRMTQQRKDGVDQKPEEEEDRGEEREEQVRSLRSCTSTARSCR